VGVNWRRLLFVKAHSEDPFYTVPKKNNKNTSAIAKYYDTGVAKDNVNGSV